MNHLKKYHAEFYKWNKLWSNLRYTGVPPFVVVLFISDYQSNLWLVLAAFVLLVAPLPVLYAWKWNRVKQFQREWKNNQNNQGTADETVGGTEDETM